jgi:hypothetical protein
MTQGETGGRFIRSGFWLLLLGLLMSFGMVLHYVVGAQYPTGEAFLQNVTLWYACPWTLSTAVVLGGALGMIAIGAIYATLARFEQSVRVEGMERAAWPLCTFALLAMFLTGYVGYFVVDAIWPTFYYSPIPDGKNVWLFMQLACMVVYAVGVVIAFNGIRRASYALA